MTTNLLNNLSNVLKKGPSETQRNPLAFEAQSAAEKSNRVLITCLSRVNHLIQYRCMRYAAMIFAVLVMSMANVGTAWGETYTWSFANGSGTISSTTTNFTSTSGSKTLIYDGGSSCAFDGDSGNKYLKMGGKSSYSSEIPSDRFFKFLAPSSSGTVSISYAGTVSPTEISAGSNGSLVWDVITPTANETSTSKIISGLTAGSTYVYISCPANKSYIKSITWTDAALPYERVYYSEMKTCVWETALEPGASFTAHNNIGFNGKAGSGWNSYFSNYLTVSSSGGYATATFSPALALTSNDVDKGRIRVYFSSTGDSRNISLEMNGNSAGSYNEAKAYRTYVAEYTIPDATENLSTLKMYQSGNSGIVIFAIEVLTYSASPSCTARTFKSGEKVYFKDQESNFDFDALWKVSSGNVYAYFWNDTENAWSSYGSPVEGEWNAANTIYELTVPGSGKEYTHVLFTRGNNNTCFDCGSTWDKTTNQEPCEGKNLFYVEKGKYADHIYYGHWGNFTPAGKTVYFDNRNVSTWTTAYVRIGHGSNNSAWGAMTKVAGTKYLYSQSTSKYASHTDFAIADKAGWTGNDRPIDQPYNSGGIKPNDSYKMTMQTNYQQYAIDSNMYICPKATSITHNECQYYQVTNANSTTSSYIDDKTIGLRLPQYTVTSSATNCTVTLAKFTSDPDAVSPTTSNISSGDEVNPTQYVKVTVTPNTGYQFSSVSLTSSTYEQHTAAAAGTPGVYAILADCEISASCTPCTYNITYLDGGASDNITFTGNHMPSAPTTHTYNTATTLQKASKAGYVFGGWYDNYSCTGAAITSVGATAKTADFKLYAKWTAVSLTALANNTLYTATDIVPDGLTVSSTEYYYPGVSANNRFNGLGTGSSDADSGPVGFKTANNTVDGTAFTNYLDFSKSASVSSYIPTNHAIQFVIPAAGKLEIWCTTTIYLSNGSSETSIGSAHTMVDVAAGTYYLYAKNGGKKLYGIKFKPTFAVSAVTSTGDNTKGSVSAGASRLLQGGTTTITASPATGYQVTNWGVSGTGSTISPSGSSNSNTTTLTMGTANTTVTVTFGAINYSVTYSSPSNGDYTIKVGDGSATSATKTANYGNTITLAATPAEGYSFSAWTITNTSTSADVTSTLLGGDADDKDATFTMPAYGVTVTATFAAACSAPAAPTISGTTTWAVGDNISLTATCASGADASTTYTWYKGANWATASAASPVQAAATGSSGYTLTINSCDADDKGTYWCEASNGTGCEAHNTTGYTIDVPLGAHTLTWYPNVNTAESSIGTASKSSTTSLISNSTDMSNIGNYGSLTIASSAKDNLTSKIEAPTAYAEAKYMYVTFDVPTGYKFTPSSVSVKVQPVSGAGDAKLILSDTNGHSINKTQSSCTKGEITTVTMTNGSSVAFTGTVTLQIYCYGSSTGTYRLGSPITINGTLEAYSAYAVTYAAGGAGEGSVPVDENSPYEAGETVTVLGNTGWLFKSGYNFAGWDSGNDGVKDYDEGDTFTIPAEDVTLTAVWGSCTKPGTPSRPAIEEGTLTHTGAKFYCDPVGGTANSSGYKVSIVKVSDGSTVLDWTDEGIESEGGAPVYTATGLSELTTYHFIVRAKGASGYCDYGDTARLTFTTLGTPYTITYHLNGASWINEGAATYHHGTGYTLPVAGDMSNTGYTFDGWYANSGLTGDAVTVIGAGATGNKEYWAKWTENEYDVTYNANGGSGDAMSATHGHYVTISDNSYTAPSGKAFVEWNTTEYGDGASYSPGDEIELTGDMTLYAIWAKAVTTINWSVTKVDDKLYRGGGGYSVTAEIDDANWDASASDASKLELTATEGVVLKNVTTSINASGKAQITANFDITTDVNANATKITFTLNVPENNDYAPAEDSHDEDLEDCGGGLIYAMHMTAYNTCEVNSTYGGSASLGGYSSSSSDNVTANEHTHYKPSGTLLTATLKSGLTFQAGDIVTLYMTASKDTKTTGYKICQSAGSSTLVQNVTEEMVSGTEYEVSATLTAAMTTIVGVSSIRLDRYNGDARFYGMEITRSSGGGGTVTPTLSWETDLTGGESKRTSDDNFVHTASQDMNSLGAITYSSNNTAVATVNTSTGEVHLEGAAGNATITATIAASGCFDESSISYTITVVDDCDDVAGTIETEDLGCDGIKMTVTGHTTTASTSYEWYKVDSPDELVATDQDNYTTTTAGSYYVIVRNTGDRHCAKRSRNTVTVEAQAAATATKIVDSWYVKNGRRTPDVELVQTTNAESFTVTNKGTSAVIWNSDGTTTTGFGGCGFHMDENGIIYLNGTTAEDGSGDAPSGLTGDADVTLTITAIGCGGNESKDITIHCQEATNYKEIAFVVDGDKGKGFDQVTSGHADGTELYEYLDSVGTAAGKRLFRLTEQNIYSTTDEKAIREHYSQFDAIIITDDPSTKKVNNDKDDYKTKGYVNAFGTMIDVRPILTMEAYVSALKNWGSKGIKGNPTSPNPRQYEMRLQCKDHEIYSGLPAPAPGTHVWSETIGGEEYRHVIMIDSTKSPYTGVAYNADTDDKPALQGFTAEAMGDLLGLGVISNGALQAGIERQEEPAARLLLLGVNAKALPNALTAEGKRVISNALTYLLKTNMEEVDDCSNYFTGKTSTDWNTVANWSKGSLPNYETKVRILAPCEVSGVTAHVAQVDIVSSGESSIRYAQVSDATCNGKLTINANGALIVEGKVRAADAPHFATNDLKPTTVNDLVLNTSSANQAALIFNNDEGKTQATVNLYSLGRTVSETNQFQYFAIPMSYLSVNPTFANETHGITIYTYVWLEATGWERRGYYTDLYAFEGIGITTDKTTAHEYTMKGTLASTKDQEIPITADGKKLNLIGNSWTAPIQISELEASDFGDASSAVEQTVYIYCTGHGKATSGDETETAGQWLAIPFNAAGFGAWDGLKVIPSMQSFQIKTTGAGTLTLDYKKHVRGGTTTLTEKLRAPKRKVETDGVELMRIRVADSQTHTDLYLFEGDQFTDEFDNGWEANYRVGTSESAKLYARVATGVMSVAAMPSLESTPVYFIPGQETEYMFTFGGEGMGYYLNDIKMQRSTLISTEATYSFTYEKGDAAARFYISKTPIDAGDTPTGVSNTDATPKAQKIIYDNKLYIIVNGALYDATGKKVNSK